MLDALERAVGLALERKRRLGQDWIVWRDGQPVCEGPGASAAYPGHGEPRAGAAAEPSGGRSAWSPWLLQKEIEGFLARHHTLTLATVAEGVAPHAASLLYVPDGLSLIWTSDPASRHSRHLAIRQQVAATLSPDYTDFAVIRGLQIAGTAARLEIAGDIDRARKLLETRYPFLAQLASAPPKLSEAWRKASFYRLSPERITLIDNTRGFGHKATLVIDGDQVTLA